MNDGKKNLLLPDFNAVGNNLKRPKKDNLGCPKNG